MRVFTVDDLRAILRKSAGEIEVADLDNSFIDVSYADLGYDSLALLDFGARITQLVGVTVPEEAVLATATPALTTAVVNRILSGDVETVGVHS